MRVQRRRDAKTLRTIQRRGSEKSSSSPLCVSAPPPLCALLRPGAPARTIMQKLQNEPTAIRASRTRCYKTLQNVTRNRALVEHCYRDPQPLASVASCRPAVRPPASNPQNEPMCHPVSPAKTRQSAPNPAKLFQTIAPARPELVERAQIEPTAPRELPPPLRRLIQQLFAAVDLH